MKKIRIAQIGTSNYSHGNLIWESLRKQSDIFEIVGYAMPEAEGEKFPNKMPSFDGYCKMTVEEILSDPTIAAVAVETEEIYLTKYALMAAKSGKHIHMEKPGGMDISAFQDLIRTVKKNKTVLHIGYMYRYNPYVNELVTKAKNGDLGEIISVEAQMNGISPPTVEARQWLSAFEGGMMFFLGCHLIDLILQINGIPEEVIPFNCPTHIGGSESQDFGMAVFKYKNGISFAKTNAAEVGAYLRRQLVVSGSKGTVELKPFETSLGGSKVFTRKTEHIGEEFNVKSTTATSETFDRYDGMMSSFASYVRGEKENPYTLDYELELYKTILKACGKDL